MSSKLGSLGYEEASQELTLKVLYKWTLETLLIIIRSYLFDHSTCTLLETFLLTSALAVYMDCLGLCSATRHMAILSDGTVAPRLRHLNKGSRPHGIYPRMEEIMIKSIMLRNTGE